MLCFRWAVFFKSFRFNQFRHSTITRNVCIAPTKRCSFFLNDLSEGSWTGKRKFSSEKNDGNDPDFSKQKKEVPLSMKEKFQQYKDEDSEVILSAEEKTQPILTWKQTVIEEEADYEHFLYRDKPVDKIEQYSAERGQLGVFDIQSLVEVLKEENLGDIAVIKIPPSSHYCDYMVLATAKSPRHLIAITEFIIRLYKKKKNQKDHHLKPEGDNCKNWKVIDMGNIVLHLFLSESREFYDIESLWTVGEKYDTISNQKVDTYEDLLEQQMRHLREVEPLLFDAQK